MDDRCRRGCCTCPPGTSMLSAERSVTPEELKTPSRTRSCAAAALLLEDAGGAPGHGAQRPGGAPVSALAGRPGRQPSHGSHRLGGPAGQAGAVCGAVCSTRSPGRCGRATSTPTPAGTARTTTPASYCDYASACHFQDGRDGDRLRLDPAGAAGGVLAGSGEDDPGRRRATMAKPTLTPAAAGGGGGPGREPAGLRRRRLRQDQGAGGAAVPLRAWRSAATWTTSSSSPTPGPRPRSCGARSPRSCNRRLAQDAGGRPSPAPAAAGVPGGHQDRGRLLHRPAAGEHPPALAREGERRALTPDFRVLDEDEAQLLRQPGAGPGAGGLLR